MDGFDQLNSLNPENEINSYQQQDDLVGSDIPANPEGRRLKNVFDSDSTTQQPDISWITDDVDSNDFLPIVDRDLFLVGVKWCNRCCTTKSVSTL